MPDLIGQHIGQYEIVALLGRGGMAEVYRARQTLAGGVSRDVALKLIDARLAAAPEFIARFKREAQTLVSLSHPHILKAFDFGQYQDTVYLVMELLTGGSLAELIRQGPLPLDTILRVLDHTSRALDYAHSKGLVHRDLKPQNVLLDESGNAFLTDFGIVKLLNQGTVLTQSQVAIGTPAYMAPEQWTGDALDARADLYSLGVMLFEMLTGRVPFRGDTPHRVMFQHISEAPPPVHTLRTDIPPGVDQVITTAMSKDPAQRYSTAIAMLDAFKALLGGQANIPTARPATGSIPPPGTPTSAPTPTAGTKQLPATGGNRALIIGIAAVIVIAVLGAGGFAISQSSRSGAATPTLAPSEGTQNTPIAFGGTTAASSTAAQTATVIPPSDTAIMSTATPMTTPIPPTDTLAATLVPPTAIPTATATLGPPTAAPTFTATAVPPANTNVPTVTLIPPTRTPTHVPPTHTPTAVPTSLPTHSPTVTQPVSITVVPPLLTAVIRVTLIQPLPILSLAPTATSTPKLVAVLTVAPIVVNTVRPILLLPTNTTTATPGSTITPVKTNKQWKSVVQTFNGVPMVLVPPGCFQMGSTNGDTDEKPITPLCFDTPFWLDQYEVSQAQFNHFGGQAANPPGFPGNNRPVENITWSEAVIYCGVRGAGLPTEAQWEYAARGPDNLIYPWGNTFVAANVVYEGNSNGQTADVSSNPGGVSWVGALDLSGNVWGWTNSLYKPYPYNPDDGRELPDNNPGDLRVVKGGSWDYDAQSARGSTRNGLDPTGTYGDVGVRCAQDY